MVRKIHWVSVIRAIEEPIGSLNVDSRSHLLRVYKSFATAISLRHVDLQVGWILQARPSRI